MSLQVLWFVLIAVLWSGYFVLEGFDFGVGMLLPFLPRKEREREVMFESIGPVWDGNEVWLVVAAGATFAAFPAWYATMFSGFYLALLLVLVLLIVRVVSFEWREKGEGTRWRAVWLGMNALGSYGVPLVWGIALANLLHGVPLDTNGDYAGDFWDLFSLYTVFAGVTFVALFAFHGAAFLSLRTTGDLHQRAVHAARRLALPAAVLGIVFAAWTVQVAVDRNDKDVFPPALPAALAVVALALAALFALRGQSGRTFLLTAVATVLTVATLFTSLYPSVLVSSPEPANSLTIDNAASAHYTLAVISIVALLVLPLILLYQSWTYYVFRGRLGGDELPPAETTPAYMRPLDPRLLRRARAARTLLTVDVVLGVATAMLVLVQATLLARIVARAFDGAPLDELTVELALLVLAFAGRGALGWAAEVAGRRAASTVLSELRLALVAQRVRDRPAALDGTQGAEVAAAAVQGVDALAAYFGRYLPQVVLACVVPVAVLAWVAVIDLGTAAIMLLTLPLVPVFMWLIGRYTEERTRARWESLRLLSTHFLDVVRGLPTLRAFGRSREQAAAIADVSDRYRRATMGTLRVGFLSGSVLELAATLGVALVAVTVGIRLTGGGLGLQAGLTVLVLAPELYLPLRQLGAQFHASADGLAVAERMLELLDQPPEIGRGGDLEAPSPALAPVRLEGVGFAYPSRPGLVLDGLELELRPCETVALVGESGAGKSTVASLLLRLAEPSAGRITVGGVDLADCRTESWRRHVAWVPQHPTLLHGTVAANIRLGDPAASDERVHEAAALAGADVFVRGLQDGYETVVGDGGRPLSAGERRRIALARAFLRAAPLVVLDEPTADLDAESARVVAAAVERLRRGRTVLLIAHRPELVAHADRVLVLTGGRVEAARATEAA